MALFDAIRRLFTTQPAARFGMEELSRRLGRSEADLRKTPIHYHTFTVPKRTGGVRTIHAPDPELRQLQRIIARRLLRKLQAHPSATGFEKSHSIVTNARTHVGKEVVVRLDLKDFFQSTRTERVSAYFRRLGWSDDAAGLLTALCTHEGSLPPGAPTSPRLSNLLNVRLDKRLAALSQHFHVAYSRYADDITFSAIAHPTLSERRINAIIHAAKRVIADEGYQIHSKKKLHISRRHDRQMVTGLVVNHRVNLPRKTRRWLRAVEHHHHTGKPATLTSEQLTGWRSLRHMIETQGVARA